MPAPEPAAPAVTLRATYLTQVAGLLATIDAFFRTSPQALDALARYLGGGDHYHAYALIDQAAFTATYLHHLTGHQPRCPGSCQGP